MSDLANCLLPSSMAGTRTIGLFYSLFRCALLSILIIFLTAACGQRHSAMVEIVKTPDALAICAEKGFEGSPACATWEDTPHAEQDMGYPKTRCVIYIMPQDYDLYEPGILGHELRHCIEGNWH